MAEWNYRAAPVAADRDTTIDLLETHSFLHRTAFNRAGSLIANVQHVRPGDIVHIAFASKIDGAKDYSNLGSFRVLGEQHPDHGGWVESKAAVPLSLFQVRPGSPLEQILAGTSYSRDPVLKLYTGWYVEEVEPRSEDFSSADFPGQGTIYLAAGPPISAEPLDPDEDIYTVQGTEQAKRVPTTEPAWSTVPPPTEPARRLTLPSCGRALGVDWSGARQAGKKIWAAALDFTASGNCHLDFVRRPFAATTSVSEVADRFAGWLHEELFDVAGFDFCFGLARGHNLPGLPRSGPVALGTWLASHHQTPESFRSAIGKEAKRETDRHRGSPFAPTNLRMHRQTFWGLRALAQVDLPILPWGQPTSRVIVEVLPAHVVRGLCPGCRYKGRTASHRDARERLLKAVEAACGLTIDAADRAPILDDREGDALDAILAAIAAGAAKAAGFAGPPSSAATSGEGWIYSID